jgi:Beta-propeller repeat
MYDDGGFGIAVDAAGNSYVTGYFSGTATFGGNQILPSAGSSVDIFVAKYDTSGALQWVKSAGGSGSDYGRGIAVDATGNSYVTGFFSNYATFGEIDTPNTVQLILLGHKKCSQTC